MSKIASFSFSGVRLSRRIGPAITLTTLLLSAAAIAAMSSPVDVDSSTDKDDHCVTIPGRRSPFCGETSFKEFAYVANSFPGSISGYKVDTNTGALRPVHGKMFASGKKGASSLATDAKHRFVYVANPSDEDNDIAGFKINAKNGRLTPLPGSPFQAGLHPSFATVDPSARFLYVTNSGSNNVSVFHIDPNTGALTPAPGSPFAAGASPSSIAIDPNGRFALVTNELAASLSVYWIDIKSGALSPVVGVPPVITGASPVSVAIDPVSGTFAFVANRGDESVSAYMIEADIGLLIQAFDSPFKTGPEPSAVTVDPAGQTVYVTDAAGISAYSFNPNAHPCCPPESPLALLPGSPFAAGTNPSALALDYSGSFAYVVSKGAADVSGYKISNGAFIPMTGSPFQSGADPVSINLVVIPKAAYLTTDLGVVTPTAVNEKGDVTGSQPVPGYPASALSRPFLYSDGARQALPAFSGHQATGLAINDRQEVVGQGDIISGFTYHALLFSDGITTDLDGRGIGGQSSAQDINDQGHIAGYISTTASTGGGPIIYHAFIYTGGTIQDIGTLGGYESQAFGINNFDEVTGESGGHMFVYSMGVFHDLGALNGAATYGRRINDKGEILGFTTPLNSPKSSFLYRDGVFHTIPTLGGTYSDGSGLNSSGAVVGTADVSNGGPTHAFLFFENHITDLNELVDPTVPLLTRAADINDRGQIVATGLNGHGYLLTPRK